MASVYQKIHALALKAQAHHQLQFHQTPTCKTDCCHQEFDASLRDLQDKNHQSVSGLNENIMMFNNPIDNTISSLSYSLIPYFLFENHNKHSPMLVIRSGDGWFEDVEEDIRTKPYTMPVDAYLIYVGRHHMHTDSSQVPELDSDTDSSFSAPSDSEAEHFRVTDEVVSGKHELWEEKLGDKISHLQHHSPITALKTPQNTPSPHGMARLRMLSPGPIKTAGFQEKNDISRVNVFIQGDIEETISDT